jgi:hypothetical protein
MTCYLCRKPITARQQVEHHHPIYKSRGGLNAAPTHLKCHREHHSACGDFREWGRQSAETRRWAFNLKHVKDHPAYDFDRQYYLALYAR